MVGLNPLTSQQSRRSCFKDILLLFYGMVDGNKPFQFNKNFEAECGGVATSGADIKGVP